MASPLPLVVLDSCDSTSTRAQALVSSGRVAPFAIQALSQESGRGQQGKVWNSPVGNLYLSLVIPAGTWRRERIPLLPLEVATILAAYLEERFAFRPTLKWPNDLLFATAKLGGILCEASSQGADWGPFIIGIGLNVNIVPELPREGGQGVTALREILGGGDLDVKAIGVDLVSRFDAFAAGQTTFDQAVYERYAIESGQALSAGAQDTLQIIQGIQPDGALSLSPAHEPGMLTRHSSAAAASRWLYQHPNAPLLLADCGNSALKLQAYAEHARATPAFTLSVGYDAMPEALGRLKAALVEWGWRAPYPLHFASVAPAKSTLFQGAAREQGLLPVAIPKRSVRVLRSQYQVRDLGIDRLALLEAVAAEKKLACPIIIVSAGTATTVDVLVPEQGHLGGLIMAGLRTQLDALHAATGLLPAIGEAQLAEQWHELVPRAPCGRTTEEAMVAAALHSTVATIERVRAWVQSECRARVHIRMTGGLGHLVAEPFGLPHEPDLVLRGLRVMVRGG